MVTARGDAAFLGSAEIEGESQPFIDEASVADGP
jgi:hypothetical protein